VREEMKIVDDMLLKMNIDAEIKFSVNYCNKFAVIIDNIIQIVYK
jgi:hypothetical protein